MAIQSDEKAKDDAEQAGKPESDAKTGVELDKSPTSCSSAPRAPARP